ncbi:class I SAM-dependent methyltransferase [Puniceicoccales bacterium CK1056]|uniref:Class I SAM-dependent methyltransferase n=1 Tax=Oceanipulchritudo coccoides TaxID=2706888 RepID=A0A6B2M427_9BACT|nr:class I SAM-dependent methyltransferase [Oceanipulchritudo coccoides]NDV63052.1 class I SAM-dependent methyltransferase [Oceanipulchritudo coccoides]
MNITSTLQKIASEYPPEMRKGQQKDVARMAFNVEIALEACAGKQPSDLEICDIGGGIGLFSIGCAVLGCKRSVLIDDFDDPVNHELGPSVLNLHRSKGVEVVTLDVIEKGLEGVQGPFDVITAYDTMEHWHNSPKKLFHEAIQLLKPGGAFILSGPNCANLKKRFSGLFGNSKWSSMDGWYETEKFRGHVREPDVSDLLYIGRDLGLKNLRIIGRNWMGYHSRNSVQRSLTRLMDKPLRLRPQLCSNIYLVGIKS